MTDWVTEIGERIVQKQKVLERKDSESPLLKMGEVEKGFGLHYDFSMPEGKKYLGKPTGEALEEYVQDLERAAKIK